MLISSTYTSLRDSHSVTKNQVIFISLTSINIQFESLKLFII